MREIDILYTNVEVIINKLNSYIIQDLRSLKDPERESLTEAYGLLVQTLSCLDDASFYRQPEVNEEEEAQVFPVGEPLGPKNSDPAWYMDDTDYSKVYSNYTSEQKGEEVPEGTPIDNSNHTYFMGDERKFNWAIANAIKHVTGSNTVNYDNFYIITAGGYTIQIKRKEGI
jgi:hypothetical protein